MEQFLKDLVLNSEGLVAYTSIFGVLVACGLGVPLPEDVSLILGGFLAHEEAVSLPAVMAVCFLGILIGDTFIYTAGRRVGAQVGGRPEGFLARVVTPSKRAKVERLFASHGQKIIMLARFLPGVRAVTYFTAGSARMGYGRFIFWDGLAATASVPLLVYLGYRFGGQLELVLHKLKKGEFAVVAGFIVLLAGFVLFRYWKNAREARTRVPPEASGPTTF